MSRRYVEEAEREKKEMAKVAAGMCKAVGGKVREVAVPVWDEVVAEVLAEAVRRGSRPTVLLAESLEKDCCVDTLGGPVEAETFYKDMREKYGLFQEGKGAYKLLPQKDFVAAVGSRFAKDRRFVLTSASLNCANGGVLVPARTKVVAAVARVAGVQFFVAGEGFRNVGVFPLPSRSGVGEEEKRDELVVQVRKDGLELVVSKVVEMQDGIVLIRLTAGGPYRGYIHEQARLQSYEIGRRDHQELVLMEKMNAEEINHSPRMNE